MVQEHKSITVEDAIKKIEKHGVVPTQDTSCQMYSLVNSGGRVIVTCDEKGNILQACCYIFGKLYWFHSKEAKQISDICKKMVQQNVKERQSR